MSAKKMIVLENSLGQKVRTLEADCDRLYVIYRFDSKRVESHCDLSALIQENIPFSLLQMVNTQELSEEGMSIAGLGKIKIASSQQKNSPTHELVESSDEEKLATLFKQSSAVHVCIVAMLMIMAWAYTQYMTEKQEEKLVTINLPKNEEILKAVEAPHVKVSEHKIKKSDKVFKQVNHKKLLTKPYQTNTNKAVDVKRVGALAALGGLKQGHKDAEGLDLKSLKNIRSAGVGNGGGGVGSAGRGGIKGYLPGTGLIAGSAGQGGMAQSAGGYGTKGVGGGRAGYGKISVVGGTSAVSLPLDDEATVEGGLDRDQIIAVINKNRGQIVYCYEKGLQAQPNINGRVAVSFVIGPNGRIHTAHVAQSSLSSHSVESCIVDRMKTWQFPQPVGKVNVDVLYPFELMRVSSR